MTCKVFDTPGTVPFNQVLTDIYDLIFLEMLMIKWCIRGFYEPFAAMITVVLLMPCSIPPSFDYIFSLVL